MVCHLDGAHSIQVDIHQAPRYRTKGNTHVLREPIELFYGVILGRSMSPLAEGFFGLIPAGKYG
jgi:hypothetical protein